MDRADRAGVAKTVILQAAFPNNTMPVTRFHALFAILLISISTISTSAAAEKYPKKKKPAKSLVSSLALPGPSYAQRSDAMLTAEAIAKDHQLNATWVRQTLAQAHYIPAIAKAVTPPAVGVAKNWQLYRSRFVEPQRIRAGVAFWHAHDADLLRAEAETGVPMEIIAGIIGVETIYGQHMGSYRVLDALATLAFDFPTSHPRAAPRSVYFKRELGQFLGLMQRHLTDRTGPLGSYAGVMGLPRITRCALTLPRWTCQPCWPPTFCPPSA